MKKARQRQNPTTGRAVAGGHSQAVSQRSSVSECVFRPLVASARSVSRSVSHSIQLARGMSVTYSEGISVCEPVSRGVAVAKGRGWTAGHSVSRGVSITITEEEPRQGELPCILKK